MRYSLASIAAIAATVQAHGVITNVMGANGVTMPGLSGKLLLLLTHRLGRLLTSSQSRTVLPVTAHLPSAALRLILPSSAPRRLVARPLLSVALRPAVP